MNHINKPIGKNILISKDLPNIVLGIGPCRSGTTAWLRVFGLSGIVSFVQPIKSILRWNLQGENSEYKLPEGKNNTIFIKETIGPYTYDESTINPLRILLDAGIPKEKITLMFMIRDPLDTLNSWKRSFSFGASSEILTENICTSYKTLQLIYDQATILGIKKCVFVYESLRQYEGPVIIKKIINFLKLIPLERVFEDWKTQPAMEDIDSNIIFPSEPEKYTPSGIWHKTESSSGLKYYETDKKIINRTLTQKEKDLLEKDKIYQIYDEFCKHDICNT